MFAGFAFDKSRGAGLRILPARNLGLRVEGLRTTLGPTGAVDFVLNCFDVLLGDVSSSDFVVV